MPYFIMFSTFLKLQTTNKFKIGKTHHSWIGLLAAISGNKNRTKFLFPGTILHNFFLSDFMSLVIDKSKFLTKKPCSKIEVWLWPSQKKPVSLKTA